MLSAGTEGGRGFGEVEGGEGGRLSCAAAHGDDNFDLFWTGGG